eukprot:6555377-Alexandrium_andersonii.AAC.1
MCIRDSGSAAGVSAAFADSEPRRGLFGALGLLGPPRRRAGFWAASSVLPATKVTGYEFRP